MERNLAQEKNNEERKEKNMTPMYAAVRSTKYPLSEVAEEVQKVLTEHAEDLGLEKMAKRLIHRFTDGDKVDALEEEVKKHYNGSYLQKLHELQKISFQEYERSGSEEVEVEPGTTLWAGIELEYIEVSKEGLHIGDTLLEKGERYLFFNGYEDGDDLINVDSISKYLPKELSDSLEVYDQSELLNSLKVYDQGKITMGMRFSEMFFTTDEMIEELKVKETIESEKGRESGKEKMQKHVSEREKNPLSKEDEKKSQEGRASIKSKLEKNKEAVEKNQMERKEPKYNREESR